MINPVLKFVLPPALLLGALGGALGCAGGVPQQQVGWHRDQRPAVRPAPSAAGPRSLGVAPSRSKAEDVPPAAGSLPSQTAIAPASEPSQTAIAPSRGASSGLARNSNRSATTQASGGTSLQLSDTAVPNPLRSQGTRPARPALPPQSQPSSRHLATQSRPTAVQTVGYQEELPPVASELILEPAGTMRLAKLEEPQPLDADPASVLIGESAAIPGADAAVDLKAPDLMADALPPEDAMEQLTEQNLTDQTAVRQTPSPASGDPSQALRQGPAQGHYQQGSPVYGQLLNPPQQPASQRAMQLLDENQRLREELQGQLKTIEGLQVRLKQQDELWGRARQEFVEVRSVVDNLTRENYLLKQQLEKADVEKAELARQYQNLVQTVEQTLDDLLLRAITEPPAAAPPSTQPANLPGAPPAPAPPIISGQQASALKSSQ